MTLYDENYERENNSLCISWGRKSPHFKKTVLAAMVVPSTSVKRVILLCFYLAKLVCLPV